MPEIVDPIWLVKALGAAIAAAIILGYLSVCLLVYQGGWQFLLHPVHTIDRTPSVAFESLRFDAAATGTPRLTAWWIPSASPGSGSPTILYLHGGTGSLSNSVRKLDLLHAAQVNIFAIDYRGFGRSEGPHPTEARMNEDAAAALDYLVNTRHVPASSIIPYGEELGAVVAATLANTHPELPAVIIDSPDPNALSRATVSGRARLLPMRLLVQEHFDLAAALAHSSRPKLLLADSPFGYVTASLQENQAFFRTVPDPKITVSFEHIDSQGVYLDALRRFLDEYLPRRSS